MSRTVGFYSEEATPKTLCSWCCRPEETLEWRICETLPRSILGFLALPRARSRGLSHWFATCASRWSWVLRHKVSTQILLSRSHPSETWKISYLVLRIATQLRVLLCWTSVFAAWSRWYPCLSNFQNRRRRVSLSSCRMAAQQLKLLMTKSRS